jgi:hypothetical protein
MSTDALILLWASVFVLPTAIGYAHESESGR